MSQRAGAIRALVQRAMPRSSRLEGTAVLDASLAVIDRVGLHGLTIRALAGELGAAPMSLYVHFANKKELLDRTFEHLLQRLVPPRLHSTWQAEFTAVCHQMRGELLAHPHWIDLLTRVVVPPVALDVLDRFFDLMERDGFPPEKAMFAFSSAMSLVLGSVLAERMLGAHQVPERRLALIRGMVTGPTGKRYPRVLDVSHHFERWSFDAVFDLELASLIRGLEEHPERAGRGHEDRSRKSA
jgi:AcrR family transcriptional regulator